MSDRRPLSQPTHPENSQAPAQIRPEPGAWDRICAIPKDTRILTAAGVQMIGSLVQGDRIVTRSGMRIVKQISDVVLPECLPQVRIPAGALGPDQPRRDMVLPISQSVVLRGPRAYLLRNMAECRLPVVNLLDGKVFRLTLTGALSARALDLGPDAVIYAEGLELCHAPLPRGLPTRLR